MSPFRSPFILATAIATLSATPALAETAGARLSLHTRAEPYCGIASDNKLISLNRRGVALIGRVVEVCNTRGYVVTAQFEHLLRGLLVIDNERIPIGPDGIVRLVATSAQLRTTSWRLESAQFADGHTSSPLRLSISPA